MAHREVDAALDLVGAELVAPAVQRPAHLADHPVADRHDQAGLLGERDEIARRHEAAGGMLPAHHALERDDALVAVADARWDGDGQPAAPDPPTQGAPGPAP